MTNQQRNSVQEVRIADEQAGQRIDNFLLKQLKGVPKSRIYRILRRGEVRVNGRRIKPEYRVCRGDTVRIPPVRTGEERQRGMPGERLLQLIAAHVLYEDTSFLVLNKPAGVAVHGGSGISFGVIEALRALRPDARFLELAHRLDRDTSGCLVVAKRRSALRAFHELLRDGGIEKHYLALVKGRWEGGQRRIDAPLLKNVLSSGERVVRVDPNGKEALSIFQPIAITETATLVRVRLVTGRTHQIRVHAASVGHPIAGDEKYGDTAFNRQMVGHGLRRLFLHASELRFTEPEGTTLHLEAPLDPALVELVEKLKESDERAV